MKPSTAKAKGRECEKAWVNFLKENGVPNAERRRLNGVEDRGDISGWNSSEAQEHGGWRICSEVKSGGVIKTAEWLRELKAEITNDNSDSGHIVVRPKGKPRVEDWFVIMDVLGFMDLMSRAGFIPWQPDD